MLKRTIFTLAAIVIALTFSAPVWAGDFGLQSTASKAGYTSFKGLSDVPSMAGTVISVVLSGLALIFFALIVYAGVRWMTAHGNEEFVTKAKEILYTATIGLILVLGSYALTQFILGRVGIYEEPPDCNPPCGTGQECRSGICVGTGASDSVGCFLWDSNAVSCDQQPNCAYVQENVNKCVARSKIADCNQERDACLASGAAEATEAFCSQYWRECIAEYTGF